MTTIAATGAYLPERVVPSSELEAELGLEDGWIEQRTGIRERRFAAPGQATSDLAIAAAITALDQRGVAAAEVDYVIVATSTPDWPQPATAAAVHGGLGMRPDAGSVDVNVVCSGFVHALALGDALLRAHGWERVLVIGADTYSRITDPADRRTRVLFGDGAGAVVLEPGDGPAWRFAAGTEFAGHEALIVPGGGSREPLTPASMEDGAHYFQMDGRAVREYAVPTLVEAVRRVSAWNDGARIDDPMLPFIVPHQSNLRMLEAAMTELGAIEGDWQSTVETTGNTASASIPIALHQARTLGRIAPGRPLCLAGYGGGLSWAALATS